MASNVFKITKLMEYESYASQIYGQNSFSYPEFIKWAISALKSCQMVKIVVFRTILYLRNSPINDFDQKPAGMINTFITNAVPNVL